MKTRFVLLASLYFSLFSLPVLSSDAGGSSRKVLIINAASPLGIACAQEISLTSDLFLTAKVPGFLTETIKAEPGNSTLSLAKILYLDCTKSPDQLFKTTLEKQAFDGIVILVAQPQLGDHFLPSAEAWEDTFQESFVGPLEALRVALPVLKKGGRVVIVPQSTVLTSGSTKGNDLMFELMWLAQANKISKALAEHNVRFHTVSKRAFSGETVSIHTVARLVRGYLENHVARYEHKKPLGFPRTPSDETAKIPR